MAAVTNFSFDLTAGKHPWSLKWIKHGFSKGWQMDDDTFEAIRDAITAELEQAQLKLDASFKKTEDKKALAKIVRNLIQAFPLLGQASLHQSKWVEKALTQLGHSAVNAIKQQQTKIKKESQLPAPEPPTHPWHNTASPTSGPFSSPPGPYETSPYVSGVGRSNYQFTASPYAAGYSPFSTNPVTISNLDKVFEVNVRGNLSEAACFPLLDAVSPELLEDKTLEAVTYSMLSWDLFLDLVKDQITKVRNLRVFCSDFVVTN